MGKRIELNPGWLVGLLSQWAIRQIPGHQLGYASGSSWMRGLKSSPGSSIDPTGYAARDFTELESALEDLRNTQPFLLAAVMMYYKPWVVESFRAQGYPFANSTYYERLHRGHANVAETMQRMRAMRMKALDTTAELGI